MSSRDWRFRIEDMLSAVLAIEGYTEGMTFEQFLNDAKTIDAVVHRILIIGEARGIFPAKSPRSPLILNGRRYVVCETLSSTSISV